MVHCISAEHVQRSEARLIHTQLLLFDAPSLNICGENRYAIN